MRRLLHWILPVMTLAALTAPAVLAHEIPSSTIDGTLRTWHGDTASVPVDIGAGVDTTVAGVVQLTEAPQESLRPFTGRRVRARGRRSGGILALGGGGSVGATDSGAAAAAVSGAKTVAVILFKFSDTPATAALVSSATARSVVFDSASSVNRYYQDASYGQLSLAGDVFGTFTIPSANTGCNWRSWGNEARSAASAAGVPLASFQYTVYVFPFAPGCGWSGLAYMPGSESWINNAMSLRVVAHELGHNFGTHHASTYACGAAVYASSGCSTSEYGDPFTVMGSSSQRLHTAFSRAEFGHLTDTLAVTASGSYTLAPVGLSGTSPRQLRISRGGGNYLYLEFRQPLGVFDDFAATDPAVTGVTVRFNTAFNTYSQTKLLDAHPGGSFSDAPFRAGESWTDPVSGVKITVVSVSPAGAGVTIQFGGDTTPPSAPATLSATALSSTSIGLSWTAATDNTGVSGYRLFRNGAQIAQVTGLSWTDTGLAPATSYTYEVRAFDAAGNQSSSTTRVATTLPGQDATPPTAPTNLTGRLMQGRRVRLSWGAASDNVGVVRYRVLRNGVVVGQPTSTSYRDSPGRGTFTYTIVAVDAAGNVSPPSNSFTIRV
jgi:chitodextrinase